MNQLHHVLGPSFDIYRHDEGELLSIDAASPMAKEIEQANDLLMNKNDLHAAECCYSRVIESVDSPDLLKVYAHLGMGYITFAFEDLWNPPYRRNAEPFISHTTSALSLSKNTFPREYACGLLHKISYLFLAKKYNSAITVCNKIIGIVEAPERCLFRAHIAKAVCLLELQRTDTADVEMSLLRGQSSIYHNYMGEKVDRFGFQWELKLAWLRFDERRKAWQYPPMPRKKKLNTKLKKIDAELLERGLRDPESLNYEEWKQVKAITDQCTQEAEQREHLALVEQLSREVIEYLHPDQPITADTLTEFFRSKHEAAQVHLKRTQGEVLADEDKRKIVELVNAFRKAGGTVKLDGKPCSIELNKTKSMKQHRFFVRSASTEQSGLWSNIKIPALTFFE